jgi:hypothetical protein
MTSITRQVLDYFEQSPKSISLTTLAQELQIAPSILQSMLDYWVRKGELREVTVNTTVCNTCGIQKGCPFVMTIPRYYERKSDEHDVIRDTCDYHQLNQS